MSSKSKSQQGAGVRVVSPDLEEQRKYAREKVESGFEFSLVVADAFVRGIRDIGYRHTGTAMYELIDNAIQAHGGAGLSQDFPLASLYAQARLLRIADGPDEVHRISVARRELRPYLFG